MAKVAGISAHYDESAAALPDAPAPREERMTAATAGTQVEGAELQLVLLCARVHLDDDARERLGSLVEGPLDWMAVLELADDHHLLALLYHHLSQATLGSVPPHVLDALRTWYLAGAARALGLMQELRALLEALEAAGAPAVVWKGPVLAHTIYSSPELRAYSDLDLIVRRGDVQRARRVFSGRGYRPKEGLNLTEEELFAGTDRDAPLWNPERGIKVDLHWGSVERYFSSAMDCERLWGAQVPVEVRGGTIPGLEPGAMFMALALHGAKHAPYPWPLLKWITDVDAFVRTHPAEAWEPLLERARRLGCLRMVLLALVLARHLLETPLPTAAAARIERDRTVEALAGPVGERILASATTPMSFAERMHFDLAVRERFRDRAWYRATRLLRPTSRDLTPPARIAFLRVPFRLARLAASYVLKPSQALVLLAGREDSNGEREG